MRGGRRRQVAWTDEQVTLKDYGKPVRQLSLFETGIPGGAAVRRSTVLRISAATTIDRAGSLVLLILSTAIARALQEDDEARRQADLKEVAENEAEAVPDWPPDPPAGRGSG